MFMLSIFSLAARIGVAEEALIKQLITDHSLAFKLSIIRVLLQL